jgi:Protein of unknown function (DUF3309)
MIADRWVGVGAPDRIRTCDLRLRRPTLYPLSYRRAGAGDPQSSSRPPSGSEQALARQVHFRTGETISTAYRRNAMYWGGGIIGLILLILLILLLTGNL